LLIIKHRVNTIDQLISTPVNYGVEIDLRTSGSNLIINHDPFKEGVKFSDWLEYYNHEQLIINVKEDGLESFIFDLIKEFKIEKFFFLDQSFPSLYKFNEAFPQFCSVRVSDFESVENAITLKAGWAWLDSHTGNWSYLLNAAEQLASINIKTCLVSPELQRINYEEEFLELKNLISTFSIKFEAVCTKFPDLWVDITKKI